MTGRYATAVRKAAQDGARYLTSKIQDEAVVSGWDPALVDKIRVVFRGDRFEVEAPGRALSQIQDLEYGTQSTAPSPAIRRVANRTKDTEQLMVLSAMRYLRGGKR